MVGEASRSRAHAPQLPGDGYQVSHDPRRAQREAGPTRDTRATALRELDAIEDRRERKEELERGRDPIFGTYAGAAPGVLESLEPEERHRLYRTLRLEVLVGVDGNLDGSIAGGLPGEAVFSLAEWDHHPGGSRGSSLRAPRPADPPESAGSLRRT